MSKKNQQSPVLVSDEIKALDLEAKQDLFERYIKAARLRLTRTRPFFATLIFHARHSYIPQDQSPFPIAATNGETMFYTDGWLSLPRAEREGVIIHEVLHAALQHIPRIKHRDPFICNIAADAIINHIIRQNATLGNGDYDKIALPEGGVDIPEVVEMNVEEAYAWLMKNRVKVVNANLGPTGQDLQPGLENPDDAGGQGEQDGDCGGQDGQGKDGNNGSGGVPKAKLNEAQLEAKWKKATAEAKARSQGTVPAGMERHVDGLLEPEVDWRTALWRYLTKSMNDFQGLDRRFVHNGYYFETLESEAARVDVCIDTSGSIGDNELNVFVAEVKGILESYPGTRVRVWWADSDLYPGGEIESIKEMPKAQGGGGTSFKPFFRMLEKDDGRFNDGAPRVAVYLTDLYGDFPTQPPSGVSVIWVVIPGGAGSETVPFGEVVRLT